MARVISRGRQTDRNAMSVRPAELFVFVAMAIGIIAGVRYYINYRHSATFALGQYLGAVKAGNAEGQYDLVDAASKRICPTLKDYKKAAPQSYGYAERFTNITLSKEVVSPNDPNTATVEGTITMREASAGQKLYETGSNKDYTDTYTLHKEGDGWKVHLANFNFLKATPNPPGDSF